MFVGTMLVLPIQQRLLRHFPHANITPHGSVDIAISVSTVHFPLFCIIKIINTFLLRIVLFLCQR